MSQPPDEMMSNPETNALLHYAQRKRVLELGAWRGRTTAKLATVAKLVVSVDTHRGDAMTGPADTLQSYMDHVSGPVAAGVVVPMVCTFALAREVLAAGTYDLVVCDGAHDYDSVREQVLTAAAMLYVGGCLAVKSWGKWDVTKACRSLLREPDEVVDCLALWDWPLDEL